MLRAGDIVWVDFGVPLGSEPGLLRPAVVLTADLVLADGPRTLHVVPVTSNTRRDLPTEVLLDEVELPSPSSAQCHLLTVVDRQRLTGRTAGEVGAASLSQIRSLVTDLLDLG
jgi:mRNA interferase MazF